jgi:hypothetical protein
MTNSKFNSTIAKITTRRKDKPLSTLFNIYTKKRDQTSYIYLQINLLFPGE